MARTVFATCPMCGGMLEVNTENGKVVRHFPKKERVGADDALADALKEVREGSTKLEERFKASREREKHKFDKLDQTFREKKKEVEESGDTGRPLRPIDLD